MKSKSLLLHFQSHIDKRYKIGLLKTMLHRAYALSSTTEAFNEECVKFHSIFSRLDYPIGLINSIIDMFIQNIAAKPERKTDDGNTIRLVLPFKDQIAANGSVGNVWCGVRSVENAECGKCRVWKMCRKFQFSISTSHSHAEKQCVNNKKINKNKKTRCIIAF